MQKIIHICRELDQHPEATQRELAASLGISLGAVHAALTEAIAQGYIEKFTSGYHILSKGEELLADYKVDAAVILAAGFGSRFVPLTFDVPKGLLTVYGERMIERQIKQLHEVGITDITIIVGYLKEKFDYLIDLYDVKLLYNPEYATKNTLATVYHARKLFLGRNVYLLSSDNWIRKNIYHRYEPYAWYCAVHMDGETKEWCLNYNKKKIITKIDIGGADADVMYGPAYFSKEFSAYFFPLIEKDYHRPGTESRYWEHTLMDAVNSADKLPAPMHIFLQNPDTVYEFENLQELRAFDEQYNHSSNNAALELIAKVFQIPESAITNLSCLKSGMTNKSFLFQADFDNQSILTAKHQKERRYICRIPGKGTELLIDRKAEHDSYAAVSSLYITENIIYFDAETGYKISEFYEHSRNADFHSFEDIQKAMQILRTLHNSGCTVAHSFDFKERIEFYENLCRNTGGIPFEDYENTKKHMDRILHFLEQLDRPKVLAHIDSVSDNFLFIQTPQGEEVRLIDWEYAGMADPLVDIAMSSIYSYFDEEHALSLLQIYLEREPDETEHKVLFSYMALGGFLWTLWAVYKSSLGETFSDYTLIMYRYAKDFYKKLGFTQDELSK